MACLLLQYIRTISNQSSRLPVAQFVLHCVLRCCLFLTFILYCMERAHLELKINIEQLCVDDFCCLFVVNKANNSNAVCSRWWRYPRVPTNEECTGLNMMMTIALLWNLCVSDCISAVICYHETFLCVLFFNTCMHICYIFCRSITADVTWFCKDV